MVINNAKCNNLKTMLNTYFFGANCISKKRLESKVEEDIIQVALLEKFIFEKRIDSEIYYTITDKGKKYRDSNT